MNLLDNIEVRVLGSLIEKEITTPDYYPLSLNALTLACNQSSNRDPVMQLDDATVSGAVDRLRQKSLVRGVRKSDSRVTKYSHLMADALNLDQRELGVICVLMLRGPQTVGELRTRTARLSDFESLADVESTIGSLAAREPAPLVSALARRPGQKEVRYAHLLSGEVTFDAPDPVTTRVNGDERITALEAATEELRKELSDVRKQVEEFRKQFE